MGMNQKKIFEKNSKMAVFQMKMAIFQNRQFSKFFAKIVQIGPWREEECDVMLVLKLTA